MLSPILALFARINKPLRLNIRSTGVEVAGGQKTFSSNGCSTLYVSLRATTQGSEFGVRGVTKTKSETKTLRFQDRDRDQDL